MSVVCWKLIVKSQNDWYFVLGWWVQCHVLCQQWCSACWRWWNRVIWSLLLYWKYSTWLGKLHFQNIQCDGKCIVIRVKLKLTFPVVQCHIPDIFSSLPQMPLAVVVHIIWRCFSSYMQYGDWKWLKYSRHCLFFQQFLIFLLTTLIYTFLSVYACVCVLHIYHSLGWWKNF